jgi:allophanate hydrolase subunit 2
VLGPRTDWFAEESLDLLFKQTWLVSTESNRIGLKLVGDQPLTPIRARITERRLLYRCFANSSKWSACIIYE